MEGNRQMKKILILILAFFAGALVALLTRSAAPAAADESSASPVRPADQSASASERALRARVRSLEAVYARKEDAPTRTPTNAFVSLVVRTNLLNGTISISGRLSHPADYRMKGEALKAESEVKFKDWVAQFPKMVGTDRKLARNASRLDFLNALDTTWLSEADRERYDQMVEAIGVNSQVASIQGEWDISVADREKCDDIEWEKLAFLEEAYPWARDLLLRRSAEVLGFADEDADRFVEDLARIQLYTDYHRPALTAKERGDEPDI